MARKSRKHPLVPSAEQAQAQTETTAPARSMKVWKAGLYIRLSVEFNSGRGDSLETQRQIMDAYLALCPDIGVVDVYTDNGVSGQTFEREGFQRLLRDAEAGKINCVVVKDLSRLGRNVIDTGYYLEKHFPAMGVRFIAVNDQYDSENAENGSSHITVPLKNMVNEMYAADISVKVRSQTHQMMKEGKFVGAVAPYGYLKDPNDCHKLIVNPDTAPHVHDIFQWIADGVPVNQVVKRLNESGVLPPARYLVSIGLFEPSRVSENSRWNSLTLFSMLGREVYMGDMVQGKRTYSRRQASLTRPEDWVIVRNTHEAIVSRELFEKVQRIREAAANKAKAKPPIPYSENILRGKIFCGHCGRRLHRQRFQRTHSQIYGFRCITNSRVQSGGCPGNVCISELKLFAAILQIIRKEAEVVLGNELLLKQKDAKVAARKAAAAREIQGIQREAERNRTFMASLYESLMTGVLDSEEYSQMKGSYERKIGECVERVQTLQREVSELENQAAQYTSLADRLAELERNPVLTARLVEETIERVTVNSATDISIDFKFQSSFDRLMGVISND